MFDRGTRGRFLRTLFPLNLTTEPKVGQHGGGGGATYTTNGHLWLLDKQPTTNISHIMFLRSAILNHAKFQAIYAFLAEIPYFAQLMA